MISPASIFRIVGFIKKDDNSIVQEPQEGNLLLCYTDKASPIVLELKLRKKTKHFPQNLGKIRTLSDF